MVDLSVRELLFFSVNLYRLLKVWLFCDFNSLVKQYQNSNRSRLVEFVLLASVAASASASASAAFADLVAAATNLFDL